MNDLQIKTNSPIRTLINKKHTRNAYTCIIFKEDVHISIVENPRPSYFCATIKTLKQHDEEKINTIILFVALGFGVVKAQDLPDKKETLKTVIKVNNYFMKKYADYRTPSFVKKCNAS